ncbi:hypothetical protein [Methylobacterium sp. Leaf108]|uniref:hypothetical protein n=1 Tax=Methylobacterium sp. Leaf108 TaxID=1736256 RepID=UPI00070048B8|nr:hypothetical protein [Methylobacterium sp. Leaf108]KQP59701.1 hypothetical protein ASF39_16240 [Methylobacterium sp. Leaf108]
MTGFSSEWLALREPADHAARDAGLVADLGRALPADREIGIVDLGCGTGSNLRGLSPRLGPRQSWRLVDHDPALLAAARTALLAWADRAATDGETLVLEKGAARLRVTFAALDLAAGLGSNLGSGLGSGLGSDLGAALDPAPDLVTAAALFDLVSAEWVAGFVEAVAQTGAVFYTALSYDGTETWAPPHAADAAVHAAFLAHQGIDKGFGAALGPGATAALAQEFGRHGYGVATAPSPWDLGPGHGALVRMLKDGKAAAVAQTGRVGADALADWTAARGRPETTARIGHADLLAIPPR